MKTTRFRITPLHLLIAAFLITLGWCSQSCRDQYPDPPGIEGRWRQLSGITGERHYEFRDNIVTQETLVGSTVVASLQFPYAERADTVFIGGNENNAPRTWITRMIGDGAMEVHETGSFVTFVWYFERL